MRKSVLLLASAALMVLLASGVALSATSNCSPNRFLCGGATNGPDTIYGTEGKNKIYGADGNDRLYGKGGDDILYGGSGNDVEKGGAGNDNIPYSPHILGDDKIYGGPDDDSMSDDVGRNVFSGGPGADFISGHGKLIGGRGNDDIRGYARHYDTIDEGPRGILGGPGNDQIRSEGTTNDTIYVSDGERDVIGCGGGEDTVYFDKGLDKFRDHSGCEHRIPK